MKILMVGEDIFEAELIRNLTEKWEYRIDRVNTGKEAVDKCGVEDFELVLLDVFLPDMKGYELIPEIQKISPETKLIAVTDSNNPELEMKVRKCGIIYYMIKPKETDHLESIIIYISMKLKSDQSSRGGLSLETKKEQHESE